MIFYHIPVYLSRCSLCGFIWTSLLKYSSNCAVPICECIEFHQYITSPNLDLLYCYYFAPVSKNDTGMNHLGAKNFRVLTANYVFRNKPSGTIVESSKLKLKLFRPRKSRSLLYNNFKRKVYTIRLRSLGLLFADLCKNALLCTGAIKKKVVFLLSYISSWRRTVIAESQNRIVFVICWIEEPFVDWSIRFISTFAESGIKSWFSHRYELENFCLTSSGYKYYLFEVKRTSIKGGSWFGVGKVYVRIVAKWRPLKTFWCQNGPGSRSIARSHFMNRSKTI